MEIKTCSRRRPHRLVDNNRLRGDLRKCILKDLNRVKRLPQDCLGFVLIVVFPVPAEEQENFLRKMSRWKYGRMLLEERPISRFIEICEGEGMFLFMLGPYRAGHLIKDLRN